MSALVATRSCSCGAAALRLSRHCGPCGDAAADAWEAAGQSTWTETCKWSAEPCKTRVDVPGPNRYCLPHARGFYVLLNSPIESLPQEEIDEHHEAQKAAARGPADPIAKARHNDAIAYVKAWSEPPALTPGFILDIRADRRWGTKYLRLGKRLVEKVLDYRDRMDAIAAER